MFLRIYLTFGDIAGKLHTLRIECTRCARKGRYNVAKLIAQYGRRGNMSKWVSDLRGDCPNRNHIQMHQRCDLRSAEGAVSCSCPQTGRELATAHTSLSRNRGCGPRVD